MFCIILGIGTIFMGTAQSFWQAYVFYGIVGIVLSGTNEIGLYVSMGFLGAFFGQPFLCTGQQVVIILRRR